jgi:hypothetical protein
LGGLGALNAHWQAIQSIALKIQAYVKVLAWKTYKTNQPNLWASWLCPLAGLLF